MFRKIVILFIMLFSLSIYVHGLDGKRTGLLLEIGTGLTYAEAHNNKSNPIHYQMAGLSIINNNLKIGYTFNDKLSIYLFRNSCIIGRSFSNSIQYDSTLVMSNFTGMGVKYYLKKHAPSLYFLTGFGVGSWDSKIYYQEALASFSLGFGYEIIKNFSLESQVMTSHDFSGELLNINLYFNYALY